MNVSAKLFFEYLQIERNYSQYTIEHYKVDVRDFTIFMKEQSLAEYADVEYSDVRLYLTMLFEKKLSRKSVARKISSMRSFYRFLLRENLVKHNPFAQVIMPKQEKRLPDFFYEEELKALFSSCDTDTPVGQRDFALLEILYATGMRVSECCQLRLRDIDLYIGTVLVHGKGQKDRYIPFGSFAQEAIHTYMNNGRKALLGKKHSHDSLFVNFRGEPLTTNGVRHILDRMIKRSSLNGSIHPHKLRHSFATHLLNNGADMRSVQELLGHAFLSSTQIYSHVTNDYLRKTYMAHHPRA